MKRVGFIFLLLSAAGPVWAEAFKNDSGSIGGIFFALFVLAIGGPAVVGFGMFALLRSSDDDEHTASRPFTIFGACAGWWAMLFLMSGGQTQDSSGLFVLVLISAVAASACYYLSRQPNYDA